MLDQQAKQKARQLGEQAKKKARRIRELPHLEAPDQTQHPHLVHTHIYYKYIYYIIYIYIYTHTHTHTHTYIHTTRDPLPSPPHTHKLLHKPCISMPNTPSAGGIGAAAVALLGAKAWARLPLSLSYGSDLQRRKFRKVRSRGLDGSGSAM
jgi:hypothetical protein